jgi:hypothetical protein
MSLIMCDTLMAPSTGKAVRGASPDGCRASAKDVTTEG